VRKKSKHADSNPVDKQYHAIHQYLILQNLSHSQSSILLIPARAVGVFSNRTILVATNAIGNRWYHFSPPMAAHTAKNPNYAAANAAIDRSRGLLHVLD